MKACYVLFLALLFGFAPDLKAVSSGDVLGQVIDIETGKPVPFAEVIFENYYDKVTVVANLNGFYYGFHIPEGRYQMRVVYNERTFVMMRVKVFDSYAREVNFFVSCNDTLPTVVFETTPNPLIRAFEPHDVVLTSSEMGSAAMSLSDVLMSQPAVDIYQGRLYVKGAAAKFFIDGSPVMAPGWFNK